MFEPLPRPNTPPEVALRALEMIAALSLAVAMARTQDPALAIETAKARILAGAAADAPIDGGDDAQLVEHIDYLFDLVLGAVGSKP
jgi:hypothetical protein